MTHWEWLERLGAAGVNIRLSYESEYGLEKKSGWSVMINGRSLASFMPTPREAIEFAMVAAIMGH
jgi:hypothetical protein